MKLLKTLIVVNDLILCYKDNLAEKFGCTWSPNS
mgnify:CR=1 FL=1